MSGKHLNIETDFVPTPTQKAHLASVIGDNTLYADVCVYLNNEYIGGRPNDRS